MAIPISIRIKHKLSQKEVQKRIKGLLTELKKEFADKVTIVSEKWREGECSFEFTVMGFSVSGTMTITDSTVELAGDMPLAAMFFSDKIKRAVRKKAKELLS